MTGNIIGQIILVLNVFLWITGLILGQHCPVKVQFNLDHLDKRLFGSGYAVTTTANYSLHKCARTCARYGWCRSFNYGEEFGFCEMNSLNASEASDHNLLTDTDWDHYDIDKWLKLMAASCTANTCPKTHRCLHGGSSQWCIKIEDSIPDTCPDEWYPFNGTCYFLSFDTTISAALNSTCDNVEANLATVINNETQSFLAELRSNIDQVRTIRIDTGETTYDVFYMRDSESSTFVYTHDQDKWIWLHQSGLDIKRRSSILMNINSCQNASIALSTTSESIENGTYRIDMVYGSENQPATTILISKYHNGTWLLENQRNLQTNHLLACGTGLGHRIWLSWFERRLGLGTGNYFGDELISESVQEDFTHLAVSRVTSNEYRFFNYPGNDVVVNGPSGGCALLSMEPCVVGKKYKYICEKPAMVKIDGI